MKSLKIILVTILLLSTVACSDTENTNGVITINFTHNWGGEKITTADFNELKYTNKHGNILSVSKLKYLVSNISLQASNGNAIELKDYFLVDVTNNNTSFTFLNVPFGAYSNTSFTFGFNANDNIDGIYTDLNASSWNWPEMLGGGYHFMQFEGKYKENENENPFTLHMGTAKIGQDEFEENHFQVTIILNEFTVSNNTSLEIEMDVSEWFKNPNIWDLNAYNINLMPNYEAQKMMNQNGRSVFSYNQ